MSLSEDADELELGLGLSIGGGSGRHPKTTPPPPPTVTILTAKDFPCVVSSSLSSKASRNGGVSGTKRNADSVPHEPGSSPPRASQVVGWPPIRASRMYSLVNQAKTPRSEDHDNNHSTTKVLLCDKENPKDQQPLKKQPNSTNVVKEQGNILIGFVKVNIDGIAIGRKVDLNAHTCYDSLAQALEDMFFNPGLIVGGLNGSSGETKELGTKKAAKLLDGSTEFVLTYEDKDGDWMLVGDVPWRMFLSSVKRLRIMRSSEANGLAPRFQERNERHRIKSI